VKCCTLTTYLHGWLPKNTSMHNHHESFKSYHQRNIV
jgi:hypothetical protein